MPWARPALLALAAAGGGYATPPEATAAAAIAEVRFEGGSPQDRAFAAAAFGLGPGHHDAAILRLAVEAVRATDRFKEVRLEDGPVPAGRRLRLLLMPWPALRGWSFDGEVLSTKERKRLLPDLYLGARPGALRLETMRSRAEQLIREGGYPEARVALEREPGDALLKVRILRGRPARIQQVAWEGDPTPYTQARILELAGIRPGATLWTASLRREALAGLRKRFLADRRYEWQADLSWREDGGLRIKVNPGPRVEVVFTGDRVRWTGVNDLLPFVWADRYSPDLLDQADRRILLFLQRAGYKDAQVTHRREVLDPDGREVRITFRIERGRKATIDEVVFERNREVPSEALAKAARVGKGSPLRAPLATPDAVDAVVERVRGLYLRRGFTDVSIRRFLESKDGKTRLVVTIREGDRRAVESLVVQFPASGPWDADRLRLALLPVLGDPAPPPGDPDPGGRIPYRTERPEMGAATGVLEELPKELGSTVRRLRLSFDRPIPFVKTDLALALASLRQAAARLGIPRPLFPKLSRQEGTRGEQILIELQDQPTHQVRRLVVQGSDETRPEAVLREAALPSGTPLDPERLIRAQAQLGNLGAFSRVHLEPVADSALPELRSADVRPAWTEGDLLLRLHERPHWVVSSGFGYDRISGYHFGLGLQRLNFQGLGRTLDFNLRAGDATLDNPGLRNLFSTGLYRRSVDIYSLGYSDPYFSPGRIAAWLPERTEYRAEAAYLDELQSSFEVRRRRVLNGLQWKPLPGTEIRLGHRFERVEVNSVITGLSDKDLNDLTKTPGRVVISAPYLQYTRDRRNNPFDPTSGTYFFGKLELANQLFGTSKNASFIKLDLRHQWNWPVGERAEWGVLTAGVRIGLARPTASSSEDLPLSERFFAGGPGSHRGVEPDFLGPMTSVPLRDPATGAQLYKDGFPQNTLVPQGGQALALVNLEYRFPLSQNFWVEIFVDSGQVYKTLRPSRDLNSPNFDPYFLDHPFHPPFRTALGLGLIIKLGIPIKIEYAQDVRRVFMPGKWESYQTVDPATGKVRITNAQLKDDRTTQLKNILISAGFQF